MKLVLDTNIFVGALLTKNTPPDQLYQAWIRGLFDVVTSDWQVEELKRVLSYPKLRPYIQPNEASLLVENLDSVAILVDDLEPMDASPDPDDNWILATAIAGKVDLIVSGDKSDLLTLGLVKGIKIVTPRRALDSLS